MKTISVGGVPLDLQFMQGLEINSEKVETNRYSIKKVQNNTIDYRLPIDSSN